MEQIVSELLHIGFTSYEAKIYLALLQKSPATGYEIGKFSGVPQAKVYENIARLIHRGVILSVQDEPSQYVPLPPQELLRNVRGDLDQTLAALAEQLPALIAQPEPDYVWNIKGYQAMLKKARQMVGEARRELRLSLWPQEVLQLQENLRAAADRGVSVKALLYAPCSVDGIGTLYYHGESTTPPTAAGRWLTMVADRREMLTGEADDAHEGVSIWTMNQSVVWVGLRYIEHEIYIAEKIDKGK